MLLLEPQLLTRARRLPLENKELSDGPTATYPRSPRHIPTRSLARQGLMRSENNRGWRTIHSLMESSGPPPSKRAPSLSRLVPMARPRKFANSIRPFSRPRPSAETPRSGRSPASRWFLSIGDGKASFETRDQVWLNPRFSSSSGAPRRRSRPGQCSRAGYAGARRRRSH